MSHQDDFPQYLFLLPGIYLFLRSVGVVVAVHPSCSVAVAVRPAVLAAHILAAHILAARMVVPWVLSVVLWCRVS